MADIKGVFRTRRIYSVACLGMLAYMQYIVRYSRWRYAARWFANHSSLECLCTGVRHIHTHWNSLNCDDRRQNLAGFPILTSSEWHPIFFYLGTVVLWFACVRPQLLPHLIHAVPKYTGPEHRLVQMNCTLWSRTQNPRMKTPPVFCIPGDTNLGTRDLPSLTSFASKNIKTAVIIHVDKASGRVVWDSLCVAVGASVLVREPFWGRGGETNQACELVCMHTYICVCKTCSIVHSLIYPCLLPSCNIPTHSATDPHHSDPLRLGLGHVKSVLSWLQYCFFACLLYCHYCGIIIDSIFVNPSILLLNETR